MFVFDIWYERRGRVTHPGPAGHLADNSESAGSRTWCEMTNCLWCLRLIKEKRWRLMAQYMRSYDKEWNTDTSVIQLCSVKSSRHIIIICQQFLFFLTFQIQFFFKIKSFFCKIFWVDFTTTPKFFLKKSLHYRFAFMWLLNCILNSVEKWYTFH